MIKFYDSPSALAREYERVVGTRRGFSGNSDWYGGETRAQSLQRAVTGDISLVPQAEALMSSLDLAIETSRKEIAPCIAGGWPAVPDAIVGRPMAMRRIVHEANDRAPINILAVGTSSGGIEAKTLHARGVTILALVMALARTRPVALRAINFLDGADDGETVLITTINTTPLDLATACWALTSQGFVRRLGYDLMQSINGARGMWPKDYNYGNQTPYLNDLRDRLGYDPATTLFIGAAELHDPIVKTPLVWINQQVKHFTQPNQEEILA